LEYKDLLLGQLTDPFRIGLIAALVVTTANTSAHTRWVLPLSLGVLFVAFLIPTAMPQPGVAFLPAVLTGLVANIVWAAVGVALWLGWTRLNRRDGS